MEFWTVLGIEATKDEEAINAAYHAKLQLVHPEEHPEEFMQLRTAYDQAIKYARQTEEDEQSAPLTEVDLWVKRAEEIYDDFSRRIDLEEWKALLEDDVCKGIDSRTDARNGLLRLCMECFYMPTEIWAFIIDSFGIRESLDELYEIFPKAYIDNAVIGGADWHPVVPYELFPAGTTGNPDPFIKLYYKARDERQSGNLDACAATIEDMKNSGFDHPYIRLAEAMLAGDKGETEKSLAIINELLEQYPDDQDIRIYHGGHMRKIKDFEAGLADYEHVLAKSKDHYAARWGRAECLMALDKLEEAKEDYLYLHQHIPHDDDIRQRIDDINTKLSERYEKQIEEQPWNFELRMDYAWSCLQRREHDKAKAIIADAKPINEAESSDLENFTTKLLLNCGDWEGALAHAIEWERLVQLLPEGETEKEKKRKGKTGEILTLQAMALFSLERYDEALEKTHDAEAAGAKDTEPADLRRRIYHIRRDFEKAVEEAEKAVAIEANYNNCFNLAYEQYAMGDKVSAFHSFGKALEYARVMQAYMYRARILCDFDEWDDVKELIEFFRNNGIEEDAFHLRYLNARIDHAEGRKEEALKVYLTLIEEYEKAKEADEDFPCDYIHEVYHLAADIEDDFDHAPEEVMARVDKGIGEKEDHLPLLELKSYLLHKKQDHQGVIDHNKKILEFFPNSQYANQRIGDALYYLDHYEEAVEYYSRQEKLRNSAWIQEVQGLCLMYLERYEEAEPHFRSAIEIDPSLIRPRANLGLMYERRFNKEKDAYDFELSLPLQQECVQLNDEREENDRNKVYRTWLARCLARLGRYDEAMEQYKKNYELYGEDEDLRKEVELYMESGRFAEGEKLLDKYHAEGHIDGPYLDMKADFRLYQGKEKDFLKYVGKMEDGARKHAKLAWHYADSPSVKERQKALEFFRKALEAEPDRSDIMTGYIRVLREFGRKADCQEFAERAFAETGKMERQGWHIPLYLTQMAMIHLAAGNTEESKKYIDRAITAPMCDHCRYRRCKDAWRCLIEYYYDSGAYEEAARVCREGMEFAPDDSTFSCMLKRLKKERKIK